MKNQHLYVQICTEQTDFSRPIAKILDNKLLYREAVHLEEKLTTIGNALDKMQKDDTTLSEAYETWSKLIEDENLDQYKKPFEKRFKQAMTSVHFLANMTDPKYFGERLTHAEEQDAEKWITDHHPEYLPGLLALKIKDTDFFSSTVFEQSLITTFKAAKWWKVVETKCAKLDKLPEGFCKFFQQLHSVPCSSASIERLFSTFGLIPRSTTAGRH